MQDLYQEAFNEIFSTEYLLANQLSPLTLFQDNIIDGPIIDIGCGSASMLLGFAKTDRELFAIDVDKTELERLEYRVGEIEDSKIENWHFLNLRLFGDQLPKHKFSIISLSNLLHFFSLDVCLSLSDQLIEISETGSLVCVSVHSDSHKENSSDNPNRFSYFKHYFSEDDLDRVFPSEHFETLYIDNTKRRLSTIELDVMELWGRKMVLMGFPQRARDEQFLKEKSIELRNIKQKSELVTSINAVFMRK